MKTVEKTLGTVATYINGRAFKPTEWKLSGLPIIRIQNLNSPEEKYNYSDVRHEEKYLVKRGDLLFAWSASLGAHIWKGADAWLNQHIFKVIPNAGIDKFYLYYFLLHVVAELYSKTHGSGMVHITKGPFLATKIPVPSLPEQERIVSRIEELFSQLDAAVAELQTVKEKLNVYRQSILKGQIQTYPHEMRPLSDFIEKPRYGTSKKCVYEAPKSAIPVYRIPNIDYVSGTIDHSDIKKASFTKEELLSLTLNVGDILLIRSNGSLSLVGRTAMVSENDIAGVFAGYLIRLRVKKGVDLLPSYLLHTLSSQEARSYIERTAKSTSGVNNINSEEILKLKIPVCSVDNQKKILDTLETHLPSCDMILKTVNHNLQQASALRQSILKQAFEGNL